MKIEKSKIAGCKKVLKRDEIPARFASVGGNTYAIGTIIELDEVVEMEPISAGGKPWLGISALINGSVGVVSANTLTGTYFTSGEKSIRETVNNGINKLAITDMLTKTIRVVGVEEVKINKFRTADQILQGVELEEINKLMPVFEFVGAIESAAEKAARVKAEKAAKNNKVD